MALLYNNDPSRGMENRAPMGLIGSRPGKGQLLVGIYGKKFSFTYHAGQQQYANLPKNQYAFRYLVSASRLINALATSQIDRAVVPVRNSAGGTVQQIADAMRGHELEQMAEFGMVINHCLMVLPGKTLKQIQRVTSHPQANIQCADWLQKQLPGVKIVDHEDTAYAARQLAHGELGTDTAVIASADAAEHNHLTVLAERIQDAGEENITTFVVLRRRI